MVNGDVLLGFCHTGIVYTPFMESVISAFSHDGQTGAGRLTSFTNARSPYIPEARCNVVREFLKGDCEWLWFLDTDVHFPRDALDQLLAAADPETRPIVAAGYWNEYAGGCYLTWLIADDDGFHPVQELPEDGGVVELSSVGMGCTLIHRSVLERLAVRYADDPWPWFGNDVLEYSNGRERVGEDMTFCARAKLAGFPIFGLSDLIVEHFKPHQMRHGDPLPVASS